MSTVIKGSGSGQINLNDTTGSIQLNGSDVLTIDSSGNLTAPNNLTVTGTVTQTGGATFNGGISGNVAFDTDTLYVDATNNRVGIGTNSPQGALEIVGGAAVGSGFSQTRSGHPSYAITCGGTNTVFHSIKASGSSNWYNYFEAIDDGTDISALKFATGAGTERMRIDSSGNLKFNSGYGSVATAYGCRAWVNFNGTGTVAIRASGNVSSITDNGGAGKYTINFTTAMPDSNYTIIGSAQGIGGSDVVFFGANGYSGTPTIAPATTNCKVGTFAYSGAAADSAYVMVGIFR